MKRKLHFGQYLTIASMLFGLFFGAGNLIFPVSMGQLAGCSVWPAVAGFLVTGVGLPLLCVTALGVSRCNSVIQLSQRVGPRYSRIFTSALCLTIGPFFAIPRCATVSFSVGIEPLLDGGHTLALAAFTLLFFGAVLFFSLRPGKILTWVGKLLNPIFLVSLGILVVTALLRPMGSATALPPDPAYGAHPFFTGFLKGYDTMDVLAGLLFGGVVVEVIRGLGVQEPGDVAGNTVLSGLFSCLLMALIYLFITLVGAQSRGVFPAASNGGEALAQIARYYFGSAGGFILAVIVTFACLKTAVGLITSCSESFVQLFPNGPSYRFWAVGFSLFSLAIGNLGLNAILVWSSPVLMFLYPLAITLVLLALGSRWFHDDRRVYIWVTAMTLAAALFNGLKALPAGARAALHLDGLVEGASRVLPLFDLGLGWVVPALVGLALGLLQRKLKLSTH